LVPVHPWQLSSLRAIGLQGAIRRGEILFLGSAGAYYQATQSVRTLLNVSRPEGANVKLPLDVVCTSLRRNFEKHFVCTAPALSEWLASLVEADSFLRARDSVVLLKEYAALLYAPEHGQDASAEDIQQSEALEGMLGAIYRESVLAKLRPGETAVPFTALMLVEADRRPFIADWVDAYGAQNWLTQLVEIAVIPIWHMLVHHGVALEAHPQNLILLHRDGWPERLALRDFHDATEYVDDYLAQPERRPHFELIDPFFATVADDEGYRMGSVEDLRELFMDTVYVFNLADLAFLLERFYGLQESEFWRLVRERLAAYEQSGVTASPRIARVGSDSPDIAVESLLKKKLLGGGSFDYYEHRVVNSLRG
jgi:3,4-dihydroxybenzoyl-citryl-spermidine/N-citryl-spermidine--spermidine ligase